MSQSYYYCRLRSQQNYRNFFFYTAQEFTFGGLWRTKQTQTPADVSLANKPLAVHWKFWSTEYTV